jgi:hypothetical protein
VTVDRDGTLIDHVLDRFAAWLSCSACFRFRVSPIHGLFRLARICRGDRQ